ncbi:MAG: signal transduction histidine kinase/DNA-binding response OmpR family regulator [Marinoscillum sp.]|jgi:signal transduction histidine kinase/DNA-binding response OmpR family regulator
MGIWYSLFDQFSKSVLKATFTALFFLALISSWISSFASIKAKNYTDIDSLVVKIQALDSLEDSMLGDIYIASIDFFLQDPDTSNAKLNKAWADLLTRHYQYDSAIFFANKAIEGFSNNEKLTIQLADAYYKLGSLESNLDNISDAIHAYLVAAEYYDSLGIPSESAHCRNALAICYGTISDYGLAVSNYTQALAVFESEHDSAGFAMVADNLAGQYSEMKLYDKALDYYDDLLVWAPDNLHYELDALLGRAIIAHDRDNFNAAQKGYLEVEVLAKEISDHVQLAYVYQNLANLLLDMDAIDRVQAYIDKADQLRVKYAIVGMDFGLDELRHELYYKQGHYKMAYDLLKQTRAYSDSFYDLDMTRQLQEVQEKYNALARQKELTQKDLQLTIASESLERNRKTRNTLIAGLVVFVLIVFFLWRGFRIKSKNNALLEEKNDLIEEKNRKIKKIEKEKSRWFVNISHELRTPLTLIKGPVRQALNSLPKNDTIYGDLLVADRNITRLQKLINEILDLSKIESGKMVLKRTKFNLEEMLCANISSFEVLSRESGVKIEFVSETESALFIHADESKITNAVTNLIGNALNFSESGSKVVVRLSTKDNLEISVEDSGRGIAQKDLALIFDRFHQVDGSGSIPRGSGVGLALCQEIAKLHEGNISVLSEEGKGSKFIFSLPNNAIAASEDTAHEETDDSLDLTLINETYSSTLHEHKILVVDDSNDMRDYICNNLRKDFEVVAASNGLDALEKMNSFLPDLIVSDVLMPRMDGITFAKEVRKNPKWSDIPFISVSAIDEEDEKVRALRAGIDDYLVKPFYIEELKARIDNLIANHQERVKGNPEEEYSHEDKLLKSLEQHVMDHMVDPNYNVGSLADTVSMSERQVYRYVRQLTGLTPANFIRELRLQRAMQLINKRVYNRSSELSYAVGFQQPGYFSVVFKKRFGRSPMDYLGEK